MDENNFNTPEKIYPLPDPTVPYWQKTPHRIANHRTTRELPVSADYVIVGSGITGASIAHKLLSRKPSANVVLLEARTACSGATGRNGGHCRPGRYIEFGKYVWYYGEDEALRMAKLEEDTVRNLAGTIKELEIDCDLQAVETVDVFTDPGTYEAAVAAVKSRQRIAKSSYLGDGFSTREIWSAEKARSRLQMPALVGAVAFPAYSFSSYKVGCGILENALDLGLNLQTETPVMSIKKYRASDHPVNLDIDFSGELQKLVTRREFETRIREGAEGMLCVLNNSQPPRHEAIHRVEKEIALAESNINELTLQIETIRKNIQDQQMQNESYSKKPRWLCSTPRGEILAKKLILATNAYTKTLYTDLDNFIVPTRAQAAALRPGSKINGSDILQKTFGLVASDYDGYCISRAPGLSGEGDIIIGGCRSLVCGNEQNVYDDTTVNPIISKALVRVLPSWFRENYGEPGKLLTEWTGIMGYTPDAQPVVGEDAEFGNLWVCAGFNGHGMYSHSFPSHYTLFLKIVLTASGMAMAFQSAEALVEMLLGHGNEVDEWFPRTFRLDRIKKMRHYVYYKALLNEYNTNALLYGKEGGTGEVIRARARRQLRYGVIWRRSRYRTLIRIWSRDLIWMFLFVAFFYVISLLGGRHLLRVWDGWFMEKCSP